jgi:protein involved in polysaccharide export with SLBB domain
MTLVELLSFVQLTEEVQNLKARISTTEGGVDTYYLEDLLVRRTLNSVPVRPGDAILIQKLLPQEKEPSILVRGQVAKPRSLSYKRGMRLSDALEAAGGITDSAYLPGLVLLRKSIAESQQAQIERLTISIQAAQKSLQSDLLQATAVAGSSPDAQTAVLNTQMQLAAQEAELSRITEFYSESLGRLSLSMGTTLMTLKGSEADVLLEEDDRIFIPLLPSYVTILGQTSNQFTMSWQKGLTVKDALANAGWVSTDADLGATYIVRVNGRVESSKTSGFSLFSPSILKRKLQPGDTVYVPRKEYRVNMILPVVRDIVQIVSQLTSAAVSTVALTRIY